MQHPVIARQFLFGMTIVHAKRPDKLSKQPRKPLAPLNRDAWQNFFRGLKSPSSPKLKKT